jgi:hypothetical protein
VAARESGTGIEDEPTGILAIDARVNQEVAAGGLADLE